MAKRSLPQPFEIDKIRFKDCFTSRSLRHFAVLITGWLLTVGIHTVSQVILTMGLHESEHFATVYKFLLKSKWDTDRVAFAIFRMIVDTLMPGAVEVEAVVDDTLNSRGGKKICGAAFQHDGDAPKTGKPIGYGVCFVIIGVAVRLPEISDRVFCLPFAARLWWPENAKVKPHGATYRSKSELAAQLVRLTRSWLAPCMKLRVIVDAGYSNKKLLMGRPERVHVTGKLRRDAALYDLVAPQQTKPKGRPRKKGLRIASLQTLFSHPAVQWECIWTRLYGQETIVEVFPFEAIWYGAAGNEPLCVVLVRDPAGKCPNMAFFDTDREASDEEVISRYSHRWSMEITNRETKSLLGSADPQCRREQSVTRAAMIAYWAYSLLVVWFVNQSRMGRVPLIRRAPWYSGKKNITFSDMLAEARRSHFKPRISRDPSIHDTSLKILAARPAREPPPRERAKL
jgi:hypothetical protein